MLQINSMKILFYICVLFFIFNITYGKRTSYNIPKFKNDNWVVDPDNYLNNKQLYSINNYINKYSRLNKYSFSLPNCKKNIYRPYQVGIVIVNSVKGKVSDVSEKYFNRVGLGYNDCNNGILLFFSIEDGELIITPGKDISSNILSYKKRIIIGEKISNNIEKYGLYEGIIDGTEYLTNYLIDYSKNKFDWKITNTYIKKWNAQSIPKFKNDNWVVDPDNFLTTYQKIIINNYLNKNIKLNLPYKIGIVIVNSIEGTISDVAKEYYNNANLNYNNSILIFFSIENSKFIIISGSDISNNILSVKYKKNLENFILNNFNNFGLYNSIFDGIKRLTQTLIYNLEDYKHKYNYEYNLSYNNNTNINIELILLALVLLCLFPYIFDIFVMYLLFNIICYPFKKKYKSWYNTKWKNKYYPKFVKTFYSPFTGYWNEVLMKKKNRMFNNTNFEKKYSNYKKNNSEPLYFSRNNINNSYNYPNYINDNPINDEPQNIKNKFNDVNNNIPQHGKTEYKSSTSTKINIDNNDTNKLNKKEKLNNKGKTLKKSSTIIKNNKFYNNSSSDSESTSINDF